MAKRRSVYVTYQGQQVRLSILCRKLGLSRPLVARRLAIGWTLEDALATPVRYKTPVLHIHS